MSVLICNIHNDIYRKADEAIDSIPKYFDYGDLNESELFEMCKSMESHIGNLKYVLEEIMQLAEDALERGQAMEHRLKEYRDAIESLGFKRELV